MKLSKISVLWIVLELIFYNFLAQDSKFFIMRGNFLQIPSCIEKECSIDPFINLIMDITNTISIFGFERCLFEMIEPLEYENHDINKWCDLLYPNSFLILYYCGYIVTAVYSF